MPTLTEREVLDALKDFDTPSITNVVATYPQEPICLGLYNPWTENWYTDQTVRSIYPELGSLVGHAVTCVYGLPDPSFARLSFVDVIDALARSKRPSILVMEQRFPPELADKAALSGGNMTSALQAVGCVGVVCNGPIRDVPEIRPMGFQYLATGVTPGHGTMAVHAVNVPVTVAGMSVAPGEIIHMDSDGACKFPPEHLRAILTNVRALREQEAMRISALRGATTAEEVRSILAGHSYGDEAD